MPEEVGQLAQYGAVGILAIVGILTSVALYRDNNRGTTEFMSYLRQQASATESRDLVLEALLKELRDHRNEQTTRHVENTGRLTGLAREAQLSVKAAESAASSAASAAQSAASARDAAQRAEAAILQRRRD